MKFRKSAAETLRDNLAAHEHYAAMTGKPIPDHIPRPGAKQTRTPHVPSPLDEAAISKAIWSLLQSHPLVVLAVRINSGAARSDDGAHVQFHRWCKPKSGMRMSDDVCVLRGGIICCIEVKRGDWRGPSGDREREQDQFLLAVRKAGGRAGFATSVDMALRIIESR